LITPYPVAHLLQVLVELQMLQFLVQGVHAATPYEYYPGGQSMHDPLLSDFPGEQCVQAVAELQVLQPAEHGLQDWVGSTK
jgi:hypothetical protein